MWIVAGCDAPYTPAHSGATASAGPSYLIHAEAIEEEGGADRAESYRDAIESCLGSFASTDQADKCLKASLFLRDRAPSEAVLLVARACQLSSSREKDINCDNYFRQAKRPLAAWARQQVLEDANAMCRKGDASSAVYESAAAAVDLLAPSDRDLRAALHTRVCSSSLDVDACARAERLGGAKLLAAECHAEGGNSCMAYGNFLTGTKDFAGAEQVFRDRCQKTGDCFVCNRWHRARLATTSSERPEERAAVRNAYLQYSAEKCTAKSDTWGAFALSFLTEAPVEYEAGAGMLMLMCEDLLRPGAINFYSAQRCVALGIAGNVPAAVRLGNEAMSALDHAQQLRFEQEAARADWAAALERARQRAFEESRASSPSTGDQILARMPELQQQTTAWAQQTISQLPTAPPPMATTANDPPLNRAPNRNPTLPLEAPPAEDVKPRDVEFGVSGVSEYQIADTGPACCAQLARLTSLAEHAVRLECQAGNGRVKSAQWSSGAYCTPEVCHQGKCGGWAYRCRGLAEGVCVKRVSQ
jgi:hypothetical protein